jgi:hypothetical protein
MSFSTALAVKREAIGRAAQQYYLKIERLR